MKFKRHVYMAPEDGNGTPPGGNGTPPAAGTISEEVKTLIQTQINGAIGGYLKRGAFKEAIAESVKATVGEAVTASLKESLPELLKGMAPATPAPGEGAAPPATPPAAGTPAGDVPAEVKAVLHRLEESNKALQKRLGDSEASRKQIEDQTRQNEEKSAIIAALRKSNVAETHIKALVPYLHGDGTRIARDKEGNVVFKVKRDWGVEEMPLDAGVEEWLTKTDDGKAFLPAAKPEGPGVGGGGAPLRPGQKLSESQAATVLGNALSTAFVRGV